MNQAATRSLCRLAALAALALPAPALLAQGAPRYTVVETGATLRQAGLETFGEPILKSSSVLVRRSGTSDLAPAAKQLLRRLQGVLVARRYVMLAYDVQADALNAAVALTPGIESPTVSPLHREGWVAVQAMVQRADVHRDMDELYELGARAILVTDIADGDQRLVLQVKVEDLPHPPTARLRADHQQGRAAGVRAGEQL